MLQQFLPNRLNFWSWLQAIIMLTGLFVWHWSPLMVVMAYFIETIIVGCIHIVKMWVTFKYGHLQNIEKQSDPANTMNSWGVIPFFLAHYFFFIAVQSIFVFAFFESGFKAFRQPFNLFANYGWLFSQPDFLLLFGIQAATLVSMAIRDWFLPGKYHETTLKKLFLQPYIRIIVQQLVVLLSGFFFVITQAGYAAALLVIIIRLVLDILLIGMRNNNKVRDYLQRQLLKNKELTEKEVNEQLNALKELGE